MLVSFIAPGEPGKEGQMKLQMRLLTTMLTTASTNQHPGQLCVSY